MASPVSALLGSPTTSNGTAPTATAQSNSTPDKQMFLQLLVSQIKNQDPLNPTDSTQFMGQLVQFSSLEQLLGINNGIQTLITKDPGAGSTPPPSGSGNGTNSIQQ